MIAGMIAVVVNMSFNYLLNSGKAGFPALGVRGAAIATVMARFTECIFIVAWTHRHSDRNYFIQGAYRSFRIPKHLAGHQLRKGTPLLVNELLWASGMAFLVQCYSIRGPSVVAGMNISSTLSNVFNVVFMALGSAVSIMVGQLLGGGKMEEAKVTAYRLITFSVLSCIVVGLVMVGLAPLFPKIYNTSDEVRSLATAFIMIAGLYIPVHAFMNATYFTLRSGGKTVITFLFDSVFVWVVSIPLAYMLSRFTSLDIRCCI